MTAYLIVYGKDPSDRLALHIFPTRMLAWMAQRNLVPGVPPGYHAGGCSYVIDNEQDITFSGRQLVDIYNGLASSDKCIDGFVSRDVGVQRLMALLVEKSLEIADSVVVESSDGQRAEQPRRNRVARSARAETETADETTATTGRTRQRRTPAETPTLPREGSKLAQLLALVKRPEGATMQEMLNLTGWKSCRGALGNVVSDAGLVLSINTPSEGEPKRYCAVPPLAA